MEYNGVLNVYKPMGYTSRDVVNIVRKIYSTKKVGHAGTLDPNATGVLPVCIGKATRLVDYIQSMGKSYVGEMTLGVSTDTLDIWGNIVNSCDVKFDYNKFKESVNNINGKKIFQIPPMYSALKKDGKKLYEYAREGIEIEREKREVENYSLKVINFFDNKIRLKVSCSKGTYIRVLFEDLAKSVGSLSYMSSLCRDSYGIFSIKDSVSLNRLKNFNDKELFDTLIKIEDIYEYDSINFDMKYFKHISNGLRKSFCIDKTGIFKIYCGNIFIGIGELVSDGNEKILKMKNIFLG